MPSATIAHCGASRWRSIRAVIQFQDASTWPRVRQPQSAHISDHVPDWAGHYCRMPLRRGCAPKLQCGSGSPARGRIPADATAGSVLPAAGLGALAGAAPFELATTAPAPARSMPCGVVVSIESRGSGSCARRSRLLDDGERSRPARPPRSFLTTSSLASTISCSSRATPAGCGLPRRPLLRAPWRRRQ